MATATDDPFYWLRHVTPEHRRRIMNDDNPMPFDVTTATVACGDGDAELVERLYQLGCEMDDVCAIYAAGGGHLSLLRYLRDVVRLPFTDRNIRKVAEREGRSEVVEYLDSLLRFFQE